MKITPESLEYFKEKLQEFQPLTVRETLFLLKDYIAAKATITTLQSTVADLQDQIDALDVRITALEP